MSRRVIIKNIKEEEIIIIVRPTYKYSGGRGCRQKCTESQTHPAMKASARKEKQRQQNSFCVSSIEQFCVSSIEQLYVSRIEHGPVLL